MNFQRKSIMLHYITALNDVAKDRIWLGSPLSAVELQANLESRRQWAMVILGPVTDQRM